MGVRQDFPSENIFLYHFNRSTKSTHPGYWYIWSSQNSSLCLQNDISLSSAITRIYNMLRCNVRLPHFDHSAYALTTIIETLHDCKLFLFGPLKFKLFILLYANYFIFQCKTSNRKPDFMLFSYKF